MDFLLSQKNADGPTVMEGAWGNIWERDMSVYGSVSPVVGSHFDKSGFRGGLTPNNREPISVP